MGAIHRRRDLAGRLRWEGIEVERYRDPSVAGVTKQVLIGPRDGAARYAVRYFEIEPGAKSSLDLHDHDHGVVVLRGQGRVLLGEGTHEIAFGDVVYIGPNETHRFENTGEEPLGFLCVVPAR